MRSISVPTHSPRVHSSIRPKTKSVAEIALELGITENTVKELLRRGYRKLEAANQLRRFAAVVTLTHEAQREREKHA
jgi:predicted transcriptional regulator